MKKLLLLLVLLSCLNTLTQAQRKTSLTADQKAARAAKTLQKQLNLTPDQVTKVTGIYSHRATQLDSIKQNAGQKGNGKKRKAIAEDTQTELNAVLTPGQQQQYAAWKEMKKQKLQAHRKAAIADSTAKMK